jgi:hypothetical protein
MARPSKLPAFRIHLIEAGYSLTTANVYVWAASRVLDHVPDPTDDSLRAHFETYDPSKRSTVRAAWRALVRFLRSSSGIELPWGDPITAAKITDGYEFPAEVAAVLRHLRGARVSARKALTLRVGDLKWFNDYALLELENGKAALIPAAPLKLMLRWQYPEGTAQPEAPLFTIPGTQQALPYGMALSVLQRHA